MRKPWSKLGLALAFVYLFVPIGIIASFDNCAGGLLFCGWEINTWVAGGPWTIPFLWSFPRNPILLIALTGAAILLNIVILYYVGRTIGRAVNRLIDADLVEADENERSGLESK
ncbi:MAG TPA: hypothetical protein VGC61_06750 [Pyrinomonadaceae bacterium]|jgi:hypothetical protein